MINTQPQRLGGLDLQVRQDHVAIMKKSWGLTEKILSGDKTLESRWLKTRGVPWNKVFPGDRVFFKDSGDPVTVQATVEEVKQFEGLESRDVIEILDKYAVADGLGIDRGSLKKFYHLFKDKKFCVLVFLANPREVEPFEIDKAGFGAQTAWLTVSNIDDLKLS